MTATEHDTARRTLADDDDTPFGRFPTALLAPGDVVHRYQVRRLLGTGGAGQVYAAFDPDLDREVALKIINAYGGVTARDTSGAQRLVREARAMASLSHPNVAEVHHVGRVDDGVFIAMELLPGGTLTEWLLDSPRSWQAVLDKFVAAGRGLSHAHAAGIVHRDFKPDNVLLTADGEPRVLDFGLARREDRPRHSESTAAETLQSAAVQDALLSAPDPSLEPISGASSLLGTPAYMAPEQHLGAVVDARADQFGFAVALYEGLFGRRPYQARAVAELALAVTTGEPEPPPDDRPVPRRIWRVLRRALARQPNDRWPDMSSMLAALTVDRRPARRWTLGAVGLVGVAAAVVAVAPHSQLGDIDILVNNAGATWGAPAEDYPPE
ncbi:MAG: protein kinase, partial [Nannocystaceae bacterium]|nr:protein kinase [Nannocystaceae bacterium]